MTIDFRAEVDKRKDALMEDLFGLLRINSERDDSKVDDKHPFGPGPVKALEHFLALAERDGYKTRNIDNYAGDFEFGQGDEVLGIFAHLDVVPAGSGWDTDPYEPVIKDGKLYARGSSDDKGPTMACYYALKIIKELELPVSKRVRFIVGTDEESGWGDMEYYFAHNGLKDPDFGFSPDAEFPIINGEKGNITAYLHFEGQNDGDFSLVSFNGGLRENMVPESASADFTGPITLKELEDKLADFVAEQEVTGQVTEEAGVFHVTIHGKSAHGMMPQNGINGATYLALFLSQFDFQGNAKTYLDIIAETLHKDFFAEKTGLAFTDPKMGELTMNAGVFNFSKESEDNTIALNFRYPQGVDTDAIKANLEKLEVLRRLVSQNMVMCHTMYQLMILWWRLFFQSMRNKQALKVMNKLLVAEHLDVSSNVVLPMELCSLVMSTRCTKQMSLLRSKTCTVQLPFMQKLSMS